MAEHTPGPWSACGDGKCQCKTVMAQDHPVAIVTHGDWGDRFPSVRLVGTTSLDLKAEAYMEQITYGSLSEEVATANARLIAAAPDLLAAARVALEALKLADPGNPEHDTGWASDESCDAYCALWDAIAKSSSASDVSGRSMESGTNHPASPTGQAREGE